MNNRVLHDLYAYVKQAEIELHESALRAGDGDVAIALYCLEKARLATDCASALLAEHKHADT